MAPSHRSSPPSRRPKSSTSRRHSRRRAWARRGRPGRCRVAGLPPSRGAPSLGGRGDHLGSPRGRVGRPIRLLAGGRRRLRDFGRPRRLQPGRAAPAGSWGRRVVGPTPYASRSVLSRGVEVDRVSVCVPSGRALVGSPPGRLRLCVRPLSIVLCTATHMQGGPYAYASHYALSGIRKLGACTSLLRHQSQNAAALNAARRTPPPSKINKYT